jgi:hypothetical protein
MVVLKCGPICHACGWGWRNNQHSMFDELNDNGGLNRGVWVEILTNLGYIGLYQE